MDVPLHVLILEDRPADAELMVEELRKAGFEPQWRRVETERDYLAVLDLSVDVILSDHSLPQYDSAHALERLKESGRDVPFIIVSGTIGEELAVSLIKMGAADYVWKDRMGRLGQTVVHALEQKRLRDDKRQAEKRIQDSEARFRALIENSTDVTLLCDAAGGQLYVSPSITRVLGYAPEELLGRNVLDFFHPEDRDRGRCMLREIASTPGHTDNNVFRRRHKDGTWRWTECSAHNLLHEPAVRAVVVNFHDITARKQAEDLKKADRRKNEFLATLAHELRNPLAPIVNALELIKLAAGNARVIEPALALMERQVNHMVRLVDDLLDLDRIGRGRVELRKERIELATVVQSAVEASHPIIEVHSHALTVTLPHEPTVLIADPIRLAQIISNLLNNAAKYTEPGGHIWLTVERRGGDALVSVRDTGIGIAAEHLSTIFEMFSQVAPALERSQGGLGIGLALVRGLVELHGGSIEARSGGIGKGSEFIVRLPLVVVPTLEQTREPAEDRQVSFSRKWRILVADDNQDTANSWAEILKIMGHETRTAYDGLEAFQAAETFRPDLVLLDVGMPKMNGYEIAHKIRERFWGEKMVLIALTGWGQEEDRQRSKEAGFDHHLVKPIKVATLNELLKELKPTP